jgi:hypothetical protein
MIALVVLAILVQQESSWSVRPLAVTVGDSVRVTASFPAVDGALARLSSVESNTYMEVLEPPVATRNGNRVQVSFTVAFFMTGDQTVATPPMELVSPDGDVVRIAGEDLEISILSVLPPGDSIPEVMPGFDPIARSIRRAEPLVYLELVVVFVAFVWWLVRMRAPLPQTPRTASLVQAVAPLEVWSAAGEIRAVAEVAHRRLKGFVGGLTADITAASTTGEILQALEPRSEELPMREIAALLNSLDRVAFAPTHGDEVFHLAEQVDDLVAELEKQPAAEEVTQ